MESTTAPPIQCKIFFMRVTNLNSPFHLPFHWSYVDIRQTRSKTALVAKIKRKAEKKARKEREAALRKLEAEKSDDIKRSFPLGPLQKVECSIQNEPTKKLKTDCGLTEEGRTLTRLYVDQLRELCQEPTSKTIFTDNFFNELTAHRNRMAIPDPQLRDMLVEKNQQLTRCIDIITNQNKKMSIPIHEGLYKANVNQRADSSKSRVIKNLCDFTTKNQYSRSINFIRDYKSGYAPIEMQLQNQDEPQDDKQSKSKTHFIKKSKQSTLNLPRMCGVSYIKPSESDLTQKEPFQPLPPLIFQCSSSCSIGSSAQKQLSKENTELVQKFVKQMSNEWIPFILTNEEQMRNLLLNVQVPSAKARFVKGIQNLWPLFTDGTFALLLITKDILTTEEQIWNCLRMKSSCFKVGILAKKSTSGKKSFLKSVKHEEDDNETVSQQQASELKSQFSKSEEIQVEKTDGYDSKIKLDFEESPRQQKKIETTATKTPKRSERLSGFDELEEDLKGEKNIHTLSLRMEIYVEESDWKEVYSRKDKRYLNQVIFSLKESLEKRLIPLINERFKIRHSTGPFFETPSPFLRKGSLKTTEISSSDKFLPRALNSQGFSEDFLLDYVKDERKRQSDYANLMERTSACSASELMHCSEDTWKRNLAMPLYYITTRDSFAFDLIEKKTLLRRGGHEYTKVQYSFYPDNVPTNFGPEYKKLFPDFEVGITCYHNFFTETELKSFENSIFSMEQKAFKNQFLQMTVQPSIVSTKIKRTKFFFGYRYMWTRHQLAQPCSFVGAGVRKDVTNPPEWTKEICTEMEKSNLVERGFINSVAVNVYHDGKEGLAQHFDDAVRFKQPIYTLRLFSDARLSFGSQFYGFCNGAFIIPLPRGCICVMQQNSYAANGVKHCVRPCDMTGKSAAVILRQMHEQVVKQAAKFDEYIDFPAWLSCLSAEDKTMTYAEQKRLEVEETE